MCVCKCTGRERLRLLGGRALSVSKRAGHCAPGHHLPSICRAPARGVTQRLPVLFFFVPAPPFLREREKGSRILSNQRCLPVFNGARGGVYNRIAYREIERETIMREREFGERVRREWEGVRGESKSERGQPVPWNVGGSWYRAGSMGSRV